MSDDSVDSLLESLSNQAQRPLYSHQPSPQPSSDAVLAAMVHDGQSGPPPGNRKSLALESLMDAVVQHAYHEDHPPAIVSPPRASHAAVQFPTRQAAPQGQAQQQRASPVQAVTISGAQFQAQPATGATPHSRPNSNASQSAGNKYVTMAPSAAYTPTLKASPTPVLKRNSAHQQEVAQQAKTIHGITKDQAIILLDQFLDQWEGVHKKQVAYLEEEAQKKKNKSLMEEEMHHVQQDTGRLLNQARALEKETGVNMTVSFRRSMLVNKKTPVTEIDFGQ